MYDNIYIFGIISALSFAAMIIFAFSDKIIPLSYGQAILTVVVILFLIFCFSLVPLFIKAVVAGNIAIWKKIIAPDNNLFQGFRNFLIMNEARVFYVLLAIFWGGYIVGLVIALPAMIKDGFFDPKNFR